MKLAIDEVRVFYRVQQALMSFVNRKLKVIRKKVAVSPWGAPDGDLMILIRNDLDD